MGSSHQMELCHMSTRLCERIHSTWVPSSRVICRSQLFFLPDCVMVVWRTKVQCDAHGQVGGWKMDSLGWDGWCLLHKSEFFTICLILLEKLYQNTDSLAWRIHLFSPWYSSKTVGLVSWPLSYFPVGGMVLTSSKFADIMPRSWDCQKPSMDGLPGNPWCWIWYCPTCPLRRPLR